MSHSRYYYFNFQLSLFNSNFAPRNAQFQIADLIDVSLNEKTDKKQGEYRRKVILEKINSLNSVLIVEWHRENTRKLVQSNMVDRLANHSPLQNAISVRQITRIKTHAREGSTCIYITQTISLFKFSS